MRIKHAYQASSSPEVGVVSRVLLCFEWVITVKIGHDEPIQAFWIEERRSKMWFRESKYSHWEIHMYRCLLGTQTGSVTDEQLAVS